MEIASRRIKMASTALAVTAALMVAEGGGMISEHERHVLEESAGKGTASGDRLARALGIGYGNGWRVVKALIARRLLEVVDLHFGHVHITDAGRSTLATSRA